MYTSLLCLVISCLVSLIYSAPLVIDVRTLDVSAHESMCAQDPKFGEHGALQLGNKKFVLHKLPDIDQGGASLVYRVSHGSTDFVNSYAKYGLTRNEIEVTRAVGALDFSGTDEFDQQWAIIKPSPGMSIDKTKAYGRVKTASWSQCHEVIERAIRLAADAIMATYQQTGWLHEDNHIGNIFFDDNVEHAYLIDWGIASRLKSVSKLNVEKDVGFRFSQRNLCGRAREH